MDSAAANLGESMKKNIIVSAFLVLAMLLTSCRTTSVAGSGIKGKGARMASVKREIIAYQGDEFPGEIPEWVVLVAQGQYDAAVLSKVMPGLEGKKVFVTIGQGDNYEFVKNWTDLVDVEVQVGDTMQRVVGKAVSAEMTGSRSSVGTESDPSEVNQKVAMYKQAVSTVELNGLEKTSSFWVLVRQYENKDTYKDFYEYYAVWTMDKKIFDTQLDAALKNVDNNNSESDTLRKALSGKLANTIICSDIDEVNDVADAAIR